MSKKNHYHVLVGMEGGYLPDINDVYLTKQDALDGAKWWKNTFRYDMDMKVTGNARLDGYYYAIEKTAPSYRLGTIIQVTECQEKECLDYID